VADKRIAESFEELVALAEAALAEADPWSGFTRFLEEALMLHGRNRGLKDVVETQAHGRAQAQAMRRRLMLVEATDHAMAGFDAILLPTCPDPPAVLGELGPYFDNRRPMYMLPFNLTGQPALSLCNGFDDNGLPLSLQIVGRHFDEATVLRIGHAYERATPWRKRRPPL